MAETPEQQQQSQPDPIHRASEIQERVGDELLARDDVTGVGVGFREKGGELTSEVVIRVYVRRKLPETQIEQSQLLPKEIDGVGVDVIESEFEIQACHHNRPPPTPPQPDRIIPLNPVLGGVSIGNLLRLGAGTLGARVYDAETGEELLLSNWHVLAQSLDAQPGEPIIQPGKGRGGDPGGPNDVIGELHRSALTDRVDAATARVTKERLLSEEVMGIHFRPHEWAQVTLGTRVFKSGRTTGVSSGIITALNVVVEICYAPFLDGSRRLRGQIQSNLRSAAGDSGSVWFDELGRVVGLHFAGGQGGATANPIEPVLDALGITLHQGIARAELIAARHMLLP